MTSLLTTRPILHGLGAHDKAGVQAAEGVLGSCPRRIAAHARGIHVASVASHSPVPTRLPAIVVHAQYRRVHCLEGCSAGVHHLVHPSAHSGGSGSSSDHCKPQGWQYHVSPCLTAWHIMASLSSRQPSCGVLSASGGCQRPCSSCISAGGGGHAPAVLTRGVS
jgi:hypothetical protein